jgi:hypothetical protein
VIVYFWQFFLITEVAQILGLLFSMEKGMHYFWQKMGWATTLVKITNSSGHPDCNKKIIVDASWHFTIFFFQPISRSDFSILKRI